MPLKFHHLGIVVEDLDEAAKLYQDILGLSPGDHGVVEDVENGVKLLSLPAGSTFIELIQPTRPDNRFARFLRERGEGLFHLSFASEDYDEVVGAWREKGYSLEEEMANSFPGHPFRLAWVTPESARGVWLELSDEAAIPGDIHHQDIPSTRM